MLRAYKLLDRTWIYNAVGSLLAPGAKFGLRQKISGILATLPNSGGVLDVGCGPESLLLKLGLQPVGVDIAKSYIKAYRKHGAKGCVGSADELPFANRSFGGVWSIGLLHHLPDAVALKAIQEMKRVCKIEGYVVIIDAVLPKWFYRRPVASAIRKMDRGRFMRTQEQLADVLADLCRCKIERFTYSLVGHEGLACIYLPNQLSVSKNT